MFSAGQKVRQIMSVEIVGPGAAPLQGRIIRQLWKVGDELLVETDRDRPLFTLGTVVRYDPSSTPGYGFVTVDVERPLVFRRTYFSLELALL